MSDLKGRWLKGSKNFNVYQTSRATYIYKHKDTSKIPGFLGKRIEVKVDNLKDFKEISGLILKLGGV